MRRMTQRMALTLSLLLLSLQPTIAEGKESAPAFVPWPKDVRLTGQELALGDDTRIVTMDRELYELAGLLSDELFALTGRRFKYGQGSPGEHDIGLALAPGKTQKGQAEAYRIRVSDRVLIAGNDYSSVAMGTVTLLQALTREDGQVSIPCMEISDAPDTWYRGVMLDLARRYNSVEDIRQSIILCRLYKIRYMHLHLTDDHAWTFPSTTYPKLGSSNRGFRGRAPEVYDLDELKELVEFADTRGVILIPELDVPAHTDGLRIPYPEVFDAADGGPARMGIVNMANEAAYDGLDVLIGEMVEVFHTSPFFHIGADEADSGRARNAPHYEPYMKKHGLANPHELYLHFLVRMDQIVKKHGKQTMVWGGDFNVSGDDKVTLPKDVIMMSWRNNGGGSAQGYLDHGYSTINATWRPLYIVNQTKDTIRVVEDARDKHRPETIYGWHLLAFNTTIMEPSDRIIGAQICAWEQGGEAQIPSLRSRLSAMSERVWTVDGLRTWDDFSSRYVKTDKLLDKLIFPFETQIAPIVSPNKWVAPPLDGYYVGPEAACSFQPLVSGLTLRYVKDDYPVPANAPQVSGPLSLDGVKELSVQAFDAQGDTIGQRWYRMFEHHVITGQLEGLNEPILPEVNIQASFAETATAPMQGSSGIGQPPRDFEDKVIVTLKALTDGDIRYTLDGSNPTGASTLYEGPVEVSDSASVKAALMDPSGAVLGMPWVYPGLKRTSPMPNLTLGKPTATESSDGKVEQNGANAVDGIVDKERHWGARSPASLRIDLEKVHHLDEIHLFPYWDSRHYKYSVEVSADGETWTEVVDRRNNTERATPRGHVHTFNATPARYVRVNMLENSANIAVHLAEVRVFEAENKDTE